MGIWDNKIYIEDIEYAAGYSLPWEKLQDKKILITGACGLIGSFAVDVLMEKNKTNDMNCKIYALGRNREAAEKRFANHWEDPLFNFLCHDVNESLEEKMDEDFDYIIHRASCTHPAAYARNPVATIAANVFGTDNILKYTVRHHTQRFVFASSNEIYGENRGDVEFFSEKYCGYLDSNTLRAGYPESKRCGEALCQAYIKEQETDVVIPRFTRTYGPTMLRSDTKAVSQFISKAVTGDDIVLKSEGNQYYSYTYVADAVTGLFTVMLCGHCGEAYNIADSRSDILLKHLAEIAAEISGTKIVSANPDAVERAGYSKATKARLDGSKVKSLGWNIKYDIYAGMERTIRILKDVYGRKGRQEQWI